MALETNTQQCLLYYTPLEGIHGYSTGNIRSSRTKYRRTPSGDDGESSTINDQCGISIFYNIGARLYLCFNELKKEAHHIDEMNHGHPSDDCSSTW